MTKNQGNKQKQNTFQFKRLRLIVALFALFLIPGQVWATTDAQKLDNISSQIDAARDKLNQTTEQRRSLQGEVNYYNGQIGGVESKLATTNREISNLNKKINETKKSIVAAEKELETARNQLSEVLRSMYEEGQLSDMEIVAKSKSFSDYINRSEYFESIQMKVTETANKVVALKQKLEADKKAIEASKIKQEELKKSQLAQIGVLANQKSAKDRLLAMTKGDESAYQTLLKKLRQDEAVLQARIWANAGNTVTYGTVKAGDIIGYIGNTGYSTGCHLHFEIRSSSKIHRNPNQYIGNGYFTGPVNGVRQNIPYGYSSAYFPGVFHTGVDYADGCRNTPIRATADGEIVVRVSGQPNTYYGSPRGDGSGRYIYGNYAMIRHTNGMYSLYGHMR